MCVSSSLRLSVSQYDYVHFERLGLRGAGGLRSHPPNAQGVGGSLHIWAIPSPGKEREGTEARSRACSHACTLSSSACVCAHVPIASFRQVHAAHILGFCLLPPMFFFERWWGAMWGLGFERASWCLALSCLALSLVVDVFSVASVHFRDFFLGD